MFHAVSRCLTSISRFPYALANIVAALWGRAQECKRQMDQSSLAIVILSCTYICLGWDNNGRAEATAVYFSRMQDILLMVSIYPIICSLSEKIVLYFFLSLSPITMHISFPISFPF